MKWFSTFSIKRQRTRTHSRPDVHGTRTQAWTRSTCTTIMVQRWKRSSATPWSWLVLQQQWGAWKNDVSRTTVFPESLWVIYTMTEPKCTTEDNRRVKMTWVATDRPRPSPTSSRWVRVEAWVIVMEMMTMMMMLRSVCVRSDCLRGRGYHRVLHSVRHWGLPTVADGYRTHTHTHDTHT